MMPIARGLAVRFAEEFAFQRKGFALAEITPFFEHYEAGIPPPVSGVAMRKGDHFVACVMTMTPKNQRYALYDLCDSPPKTRGLIPSEPVRHALLRTLVQADGVSPLAVELSAVSLAGVREDWFVAASRVNTSPSAATTAARTLLEATCKTILAEAGETADSSGDLGRLFKQVRLVLGVDPSEPATQGVYQICKGLASTVDGLASISNSAGDRHGVTVGNQLDDQTYASLAVHAAGTISLFLVRAARDRFRMGC